MSEACSAPGGPANPLEQLRLSCAAAGERARRLGRPVLAAAARSRPWVDPFVAVAAGRADARALWLDQGTGLALVGHGRAWTQQADGAAPCASLASAWSALVADAVLPPPDRDGIEPRHSAQVPALPLALAGLAFDPARPQLESQPSDRPDEWSHFAAAELVVPEHLLVIGRRRSWSVAHALVGPQQDPDRLALELARRWWAPGPFWPSHLAVTSAVPGLDQDPGRAGSEDAAPAIGRQHDGSRAWHDAVEAALAEIHAGRLEKAVLARRHRLKLDHAPSIDTILRRLASQTSGAVIFAVGRGPDWFIGATPEHLIGLAGRRLEVSCLAGSRRRGAAVETDEAEAEALLTDPKERHEHAIVVRFLSDCLRPLCTQLDIPGRPGILRTPAVQHLSSPIRGLVRPGVGLLDLADRLHPTPATCGTPRAEALDLIRRHEGFNRGWYAGSLGFVDAAGGGDLAVAIRSALLRPGAHHSANHLEANHLEAMVYAGGGIVAGSDLECEHRETCIKAEAMLDALTQTHDRADRTCDRASGARAVPA